MIKIHIHIHNDLTYMDPDVFIEIQLPQVPRKCEEIILTPEMYEKLTRQVVKKNGKGYAVWCFMAGEEERMLEFVSPQRLKDLDLPLADTVKYIRYNANSEIVDIELDEFTDI